MGASVNAVPFPTAFANLNEIANIADKGWIYTNTKAQTITTSYYWSLISCPTVDVAFLKTCVDSVLVEMRRRNKETHQMILAKFDAITAGFDRALRGSKGYAFEAALRDVRDLWNRNRPQTNAINRAGLEQQKKLLRAPATAPSTPQATSGLEASALFRRLQSQSEGWVIPPVRCETARPTQRTRLVREGVFLDGPAREQIILRRKSLRPL